MFEHENYKTFTQVYGKMNRNTGKEVWEIGSRYVFHFHIVRSLEFGTIDELVMACIIHRQGLNRNKHVIAQRIKQTTHFNYQQLKQQKIVEHMT